MSRHEKRKVLSPSALARQIAGRRIHVWGARHDGYAVRNVLARHDLVLSGYIDSSPAVHGLEAFGLPIRSPDAFFGGARPEEDFIVIASGFYPDEIARLCEDKGWRDKGDMAVYRDLRRFNYQIDVAGMCNLHCISCPRGNWPNHRHSGFMSVENYEKLMNKIIAEDPWTGLVTLYNWGEPLLNPSLPDIIKVSHRNRLLVAISSNIAMRKDFEEVIIARPDWFRISNSGWGENYETTHTGARWDVFLDNCRKLSRYRTKHHPDMIVEFFFHIYAHNRDDFSRIKSLCKELNFTLRYRHAALAPLDNVARIARGEPVSPAAQLTRQLQFLSVEEVMKVARSEKDRPCFYKDHLWIDWDLSAALCMEWYAPDLRLFDGQSILEYSLDDIEREKHNHPHCRHCMAEGIHRAYCVYGDEKLVAEKSSIPLQDDAL
jgi:MoaA/NifB/PqqE/SkfB family radical SAM enzyme